MNAPWIAALVRRRIVLAGWLLALAFALIFVAPLAHVFGFAPPKAGEAVVLLGFPFVMIALDEVRKAIVRAR